MAVDANEAARLARKKAKDEAERRWPPSHQLQRKAEEDELYIKYYREYMGLINPNGAMFR